MAIKNRDSVYNEIRKVALFDSFKTQEFILEAVMGSDILELSTENSDYDILFLHKTLDQPDDRSFDRESRSCTRFAKLGKSFVQWTNLSLSDIKGELLRKDMNKDFSLLASLVKLGFKESKMIVLNQGADELYWPFMKKFEALKKDIAILALYSFLMPELDRKGGGVSLSFRDKKIESARKVNPKFWYTALLGYSLLFSIPYDKKLIMELKDMKYDSMPGSIKEEEAAIIDKIKCCYDYYAVNYPKGIEISTELVYTCFINNKEENYGIQCCFNKNI